MNYSRQYLGKWELGCMVFNSCVYKIFTSYPKRFTEISGSAGWITALFTGLIFLTVLFLILLLYKPYESLGIAGLCRKRGGRTAEVLVYCVYIAYWIFAAVYAVYEFSEVLCTISYVRSPRFYIILFFLLGGIVTAVCGMRAVYRIHSLSVLFVGLVSVLIAVFGLCHAKLQYLAPILGKGAGRVFIDGLSAMFMYADIIFIFLLSPLCRPEVKFRKTVLTGASLGVLVNAVLSFIFSAAQSAEAGGIISIPIYPLTKTECFGRLWFRMDSAYLAAFIVSGILYLSLAVHLIFMCFKGLFRRFNKKLFTALGMCLAMCLTFTGCYDIRDVEQSAYLIALGVDKGDDAVYRYTFQLSNPLETGTISSDGQEEFDLMQESDKAENKGVNNIVIEADNFYSAVNLLKSGLSKEPELSHLKIIVFSKEFAEEGLLELSSLLLQEREIRPDVKLCLAESAEDFLVHVKPSLEVSTARYYELLFQSRNTPYAPVTELWTFVSQSTDSAEDSVLPFADKDLLAGMGIFHNGAMAAEADAEKAVLYKLLSGEARQISMTAGSSVFSVTSRNKPKIKISSDSAQPSVTVTSAVEAKLIHGDLKDNALLKKNIETEAARFLEESTSLSADILGIGNAVKRQCITDSDWKMQNWEEKIKNYKIMTKINLKISKNT